MTKPHLKFEKSLWKKNYLVIGVDEVGRGAFAGPLVLAGVIFKPTASKIITDKLLLIGINDSKKLTPQKREELSKIIKKIALSYSFATLSVDVINKHGISKATSMGVRKVVKGLINKTHTKTFSYGHSEPLRALKRVSESHGMPKLVRHDIHLNSLKHYLLMDAFYIKYVKGIGLKNQKAIVRGDAISISIAAASIIAKVRRDAMMTNLSIKHPEYKWEQNKGYGTLDHRRALIKLGKTDLHRIQFIQKLNVYPEKRSDRRATR